MKYKTIGIGEILWDLLPAGKRPGGAPANFAYISKRLGDHGIVVSRVGNDAAGNEILRNLERVGADVSHVQKDAEYQTGNVKVSLENGQPSYEITENVAWDYLDLTADWRDLAKVCDAVCFGTLAQRNEFSRRTIREFVKLTRRDCLRIFDVNLRQNYYSAEILRESLESANIVKLNNEELPKICEMLTVAGGNETEQLKNLREKFNLRLICLTRGASGSLLSAANEASENGGVKIEIADTIGAGDAFTAALTHGFLRGWSLDEINQFANRVGAFVASQPGAMPDLPPEF
ncbi:MAG: carbohydrate kinase [Pyrinomonadaceae bacterium]|nr:carbohydrate kinase [Pyrinomonadaceae bacterium]